MSGRLGAGSGSVGEGPIARGLLTGAALVLMGGVLVVPIVLVFQQAFSAGWGALVAALTEPDATDAMRLSLLVTAVVVPLNTGFGLCAAWVLTRHHFWGRRVLLPLIGLPFSVSPVVAGLVYVLLFGRTGWFGVAPFGMPILFAWPGLVLATVFVTLPYVVAGLVPVMAAAGREEDEAALTLGASFGQLLWLVVLPRIRWPLLQGVLLCTARALGEFGAVAVVSGRIAGLTNTMPLEVEALYNAYDLTAAFGLAAVLASLALMTMALRAIVDWAVARTVRLGQAAVLAP